MFGAAGQAAGIAERASLGDDGDGEGAKRKAEEQLAPSCGIAQYPANGNTVEELRAAAERSMLTLQVALRSASVATALEAVNRARLALEVAANEL